MLKKKSELHKKLVKEHKIEFMLLDIAVIFIVLFNLGAIVLTNIMVSEKQYETAKEEGTEVIYQEVNPIMSNVHNIEDSGTKIFDFIFILLKQVSVLLLPLLIYVYYRKTIVSENALLVMIIIVIYWMYIISFDFCHDLGLFIGKLLYSK